MQQVEFGRDAAPGGTAAHPGRALLEALDPLDPGTAVLLSAFSHQLRTPLTSVLGYLELITDGTLGPMTADQQRVLRTVAEGMARLAALIEDLEPRRPAGPEAAG